MPRRQIRSLPVSATLAKAGIRFDRYKERFTAVLADVAMATHLQVDVGTALFVMSRRIEGEDGRTIEFLQATYRPDRYVYRVEYTAESAVKGVRWSSAISNADD